MVRRRGKMFPSLSRSLLRALEKRGNLLGDKMEKKRAVLGQGLRNSKKHARLRSLRK